MNRALVGLCLCALLASSASAQILFSYEDLDPDATSPVSNGLVITGDSTTFSPDRVVGDVDLSQGTQPFMALLGDMLPTTVDPAWIGKSFSGFAETFIPSSSPIDGGDSIYLTVDFFSSLVPPALADDRVRFNAGFYNSTSTKDEWLPLEINDIVPDMTTNGNPIDRVSYQLIVTDGGFGGTPNNQAGQPPQTFAYLDNFSFNISEPPPPNPVFYFNDAPKGAIDAPANINESGVLLQSVIDPTDPGGTNEVGAVLFSPGGGNFLNVNAGTNRIDNADVAAFEGEKFRASFDYLVPSDTVLNEGDDTFFLSLGFNDTASVANGIGPRVAGFPSIDAVADDVWRTVEVTGAVPPGSDPNLLIVFRDGPVGSPADAGGIGLYIDNIVFEALEVQSGDFNNDGVVDAADYTVFRDNQGTLPPSPPTTPFEVLNLTGEEVINFAGDGANGVTVADYTVWANNFGLVGASATAVPEPTAAVLLVGSVLSASLRRERGGSSLRG